MSLNPLFLPSLPCCLPAEKTIPDWPPIDYIFESLYDNLQVADYHLVAQIADFIQNAPSVPWPFKHPNGNFAPNNGHISPFLL
jgi:hypothetical protein